MKKYFSILILSLISTFTFSQDNEICERKVGIGKYSILVGDVADKLETDNGYNLKLIVDTVLYQNDLMTVLYEQSDKDLKYLSNDMEEAFVFEDKASKKLSEGDRYILYIDSIGVNGRAYLPKCNDSKKISSLIVEKKIKEYSTLCSDGKVIRLFIEISISLDSDTHEKVLRKYSYDIERNLIKEINIALRKLINKQKRQYWFDNVDILKTETKNVIENILVIDNAKLTNYTILPVHNKM